MIKIVLEHVMCCPLFSIGRLYNIKDFQYLKTARQAQAFTPLRVFNRNLVAQNIVYQISKFIVLCITTKWKGEFGFY